MLLNVRYWCVFVRNAFGLSPRNISSSCFPPIWSSKLPQCFGTD